VVAPLAAVFGCAGLELTAEERAFYRDADPLGFIVFARNIDTPDQLRALVAAFRETVGRDDAPVLVDQEGGRVQRLGPPHWRKAPPAASIARLHRSDAAAGIEATRLNTRLLAEELSEIGITVDCVPVLDVPQPGAHDVIGDRAVGTDPAQSAELGRIVCEEMAACGVLPVSKHIPGHGRAGADSHHDLPVVDTPREELERIDFAPFRALARQDWGTPWAMTAHVIYTAFDADRPATTSATVISDVIRSDIGFDGVLVSDDLSMNALSGTLAERASASMAAGCDVALHCNGKMDEMTAVAAHTPRLAGDALRRVEDAEAARVRARDRSAFDRAATVSRFESLMAGAAA